MDIFSDFDSLDDAIKNLFGSSVNIAEKKLVSGGDINRASLVTLSDGMNVFLKENEKKNIGFFSAEVEGLKAIADTKTISVPQVYSYGSYKNNAYLLMEYLTPGKMAKDFWEDFGYSLAGMHKASTENLLIGGKYGFLQDNYIGAGFQKNTPKSGWIEFFRDCRISPQFDRAKDKLSKNTATKIVHLMEHMEEYLIEPEMPSLLHGDLWSGNFIVGPDGKAWLIDPAAYVGHAEADIVMTELFGGFTETFYKAYMKSGLLQPGYEDRRDIYNLYHMLNHLNLFGGSYLYAVERIVLKY